MILANITAYIAMPTKISNKFIFRPWNKIRGQGGIMLLETNRGVVYVVGAHLVNEMIISIIKFIIEVVAPHFEIRKCGLNTIVFRQDHYPLGDSGITTWEFHPDSGSAVCSLPNCIEAALDDIRNKLELSRISLLSMVWDNILIGFMHEYHHAYSFLTDRENIEYSSKNKLKEEHNAEMTAQKMMQYLSKHYNVEVFLSDFIMKIMDSLWTKETRDYSVLCAQGHNNKHIDYWMNNQVNMRNRGASYYRPEDGLILYSYRDLRRVIVDQNKSDWNVTIKNIQSNIKTTQPTIKQDEAVTQQTSTHTETQAATQQSTVFRNIDVYDNDDVFSISEDELASVSEEEYIDPYSAPEVEDLFYHENEVINIPPPKAEKYDAPKEYKAYKSTGLSMTQTNLILKQIYHKIYKHIDLNCGWESTGTFKNPGKFSKVIEVSSEERQVIKAFSGMNNGAWKDQNTVGSMIWGQWFNRDQTAFGYVLHIALPDGKHVIRKLFPQNPNALTDGGQLSRTGDKLLWIIDPNKKDDNIHSTRIMNGKFQILTGGIWSDR